MRKLLILGHAMHGKDTAAEYLRDKHGIKFKSATLLLTAYVRSAMSTLGITYHSTMECYEDRVNHRPFWFECIKLLNKKDKATVGLNIFSQSDIYVGIRDNDEYAAVLHEIDPIVIWVDAGKRLPLEPKSSMNIEYGSPMLYINNNDSIENLYKQLDNIANLMKS